MTEAEEVAYNAMVYALAACQAENDKLHKQISQTTVMLDKIVSIIGGEDDE